MDVGILSVRPAVGGPGREQRTYLGDIFGSRLISRGYLDIPEMSVTRDIHLLLF